MIRRYLLRELLSPLVASSVLLCTLFYVMAFLRGSDLLLGSGVTAGDLGRFALSMLPGFVVQVLPVAVLLAVLLGFGRLGEDGELSALFALGMRPRTFLRGPLLLGVGLGAVMALLTFTLKPWGIALMRETARNVIRRNLVGDLQPGTFQEEIPGFTFYAQRIERGPTWRNVLLFDSREGQAPLLALAPVAHIDASSQAEALTFELQQGELHRASPATDEYTQVDFQRARLAADIGEAMYRRNRFQMGRDDLSPGELVTEARRARQDGEPDAPFIAALHWRFAQLLAPLALALVAVPMALTRRGGARSRSFVQALIVYVTFFIAARLLVQLGEKGQLPPALAGYLPIAGCLALAAAWTWRLERRGAA